MVRSRISTYSSCGFTYYTSYTQYVLLGFLLVPKNYLIYIINRSSVTPMISHVGYHIFHRKNFKKNEKKHHGITHNFNDNKKT